MDILEKIEEIRKKPEHIRRRYVWVMVLVCAFFIFLIWILSFKNSLYMIRENQDDSASQEEILKNLKESGKALNEIKNGLDELRGMENEIENASPESTIQALENSTLENPITGELETSNLNQ